MTPSLSEQIIRRERAYSPGIENFERLVADGQHRAMVEAALDDTAAARRDLDLLRRAESMAAHRAFSAGPISIARQAIRVVRSCGVSAPTDATMRYVGADAASRRFGVPSRTLRANS